MQKENISMLACPYKYRSRCGENTRMCTYKNYLMRFELFKATPFGVWGWSWKGPVVFYGAAVSYVGIHGLHTYKTYNRNNDINMQKILTVYCCDVEAVEGDGGLTPRRRSCDFTRFISSNKLLWFSCMPCLTCGSVVWSKIHDCSVLWLCK